ncbi:TPR repeat protein [Beauveria bassiana ARSEF 2860]|uniref:TPR repeat protein n=1 Tax=Beauveria bassiana (strain ARSEF 2860) TaxID=655819 RepID=J5JC79_BEAB2|nr:TPR repeat protein [Beauveria bassiana ARSEF 2860]EJP61506.1 TPR repeat protein [Beauveria bassiana ARSEF 2860]
MDSRSDWFSTMLQPAVYILWLLTVDISTCGELARQEAEAASSLDMGRFSGIRKAMSHMRRPVRQGAQGAFDGAPKTTLASEFDTDNQDKCIQKILEEGTIQTAEAEEVYQIALQDFAATLTDWDTTATLLREYILMVTRRGNICEAKTTYYRVIRNFILRLGRSHEATLLLIYETGNALWASGAFSEAEKVYQEAVFDLDSRRQKNNAVLLHVMDKLGIVYMQRGRWKDAEDMHHAVLKGYLYTYTYQNNFHPNVSAVVLNLAPALRAQGRLEDAAQMLQWGSSGLQQAFGLDHPDTIHAFDQLTLMHAATRKFTDAEFALRSALRGCECLYGQHSEETLRRRVELAVLFRDGGKFQEAQAACELLLSECEMFESEFRFSVLNCLGTVHTLAGHFGKAEEEFAAALAGFRKQGGQQSPLALIALYNMATALHARERPDLAEVAYCQALVGLRQVVGHNHIATRATAEMLGL